MEARILEKWLLNICLVLHEDMANARDHSKKSLIDQAKEYVHNNYSNEALNLDDICSELGVSNSYFSSIFKKETGQSFVAYLTGYLGTEYFLSGYFLKYFFNYFHTLSCILMGIPHTVS